MVNMHDVIGAVTAKHRNVNFSVLIVKPHHLTCTQLKHANPKSDHQIEEFWCECNIDTIKGFMVDHHS